MTVDKRPLILASASPSRRDILINAGIAHQAVSPNLDEDHIKKHMKRDGYRVAEIAKKLAYEKAKVVAQAHPDALIIGADQMLDCNGSLFDKPPTIEKAREQLLRLRGRRHHLHCAVSLLDHGEQRWSHHEVIRLKMRSFSRAFLESYLKQAGDLVLQSVGAYRMEGYGAQLFEGYNGDYFGVLGLPLHPLMKALRQAGALPS